MWIDRWVNDKPLIDLLNTDVYDFVDLNMQVKDIISRNSWDITRLSPFVPNVIMSLIRSFPLHVCVTQEDTFIWGDETSGKYYVKSMFLFLLKDAGLVQDILLGVGYGN